MNTTTTEILLDTLCFSALAITSYLGTWYLLTTLAGETWVSHISAGLMAIGVLGLKGYTNTLEEINRGRQ